MGDNLTKKQRSFCMSRIRSKHTKPEKLVRKTLRELEFKYKLHVKNLPGKPDIIVSKRKTAIYINGCFWHQHKNCRKAVMPKSNLRYWKNKLKRNVSKQKEDLKLIKKMGWAPLIIWECQTKRPSFLADKIRKALK